MSGLWVTTVTGLRDAHANWLTTNKLEAQILLDKKMVGLKKNNKCGVLAFYHSTDPHYHFKNISNFDTSSFCTMIATRKAY